MLRQVQLLFSSASVRAEPNYAADWSTSIVPVVQPSLPDLLNEPQLNEDPWGNLLEAATAVNGDDFEWCLVI